MPAIILRVAVPGPLNRSFDYLAPPQASHDALKPGTRVRVPFGRSCRVGIVVELPTESPLGRDALRTVLEIVDAEPLLPAEMMALGRWAQRYYHHPPGEVFASLLPGPLRQGRRAQLQLEPLWRLSSQGRSALNSEALKRAPRQRAVLDYLSRQTQAIPDSRIRKTLPGSTKTMRALQTKGWLEKAHLPATSATHGTAPRLNPAQTEAVVRVSEALGRFSAFLLDGVTGSGKTEVYLRLAETVLTRGQQALILVPEIGLTPQLLERFQRRLPGPLALLHSGLSDRERQNAWLMARDGSAPVVLGTRSAVFAPMKRPGMIMVDEEHDTSFKQQEGFRYNARDVAVMRARQTGIPIVLGSATPSLESLQNVRNRRYHQLQLPERVGGAAAPTIELLDVRRQTMDEGLSEPLLTRMHVHLAQGGQVLLFLNRRGFAPVLICHECGWMGECGRCDARATLHLARRRLICHHCGSEQSMPFACPSCGSVDLRALGQGTQRIENALQRKFPDTGIARIDRDSTRRRGSLGELLQEIKNGNRKILIGTQMLAKGHHFPDVSLVGIVDADQGLFGADFRASERMAQLIVQVAGRAGRAERAGQVVIQTHHPHHPLLQTLVYQGYPAFAGAALAERRESQLPPVTFQALLRAEAPTPQAPTKFLQEAADVAGALAREVDLLGPVPAPMERRAGRYRVQLLAQSERRAALHRFLGVWLERLHALESARRVRWSVDVDPVDLF